MEDLEAIYEGLGDVLHMNQKLFAMKTQTRKKNPKAYLKFLNEVAHKRYQVYNRGQAKLEKYREKYERLPKQSKDEKMQPYWLVKEEIIKQEKGGLREKTILTQRGKGRDKAEINQQITQILKDAYKQLLESSNITEEKRIAPYPQQEIEDESGANSDDEETEIRTPSPAIKNKKTKIGKGKKSAKTPAKSKKRIQNRIGSSSDSDFEN